MPPAFAPESKKSSELLSLQLFPAFTPIQARLMMRAMRFPGRARQLEGGALEGTPAGPHRRCSTSGEGWRASRQPATLAARSPAR